MHGITMGCEIPVEIEITVSGIRSNQQRIFGIGSGKIMADKGSGVFGGEWTDQPVRSRAFDWQYRVAALTEIKTEWLPEVTGSLNSKNQVFGVEFLDSLI